MPDRLRRTVLLVCLAGALPGLLSAAPPVRPGGSDDREGPRVRLDVGSFDPLREQLDFRPAGLPDGPGPAGTSYALVQLRPGDDGALSRLRSAGRVMGSLGGGSFQVRLDAEGRRRLLVDDGVRYVGDWLPGYKVSPRLYSGPGARAGQGAQGEGWTGAEITLVPFADASAAKLASKLEREVPGVVVTFASDSRIPPVARLTVPPSLRADLLRAASLLEGVAWLEPYVAPQLHNIDASGPIQGNAPSPGGRTIFARGLTGTGQIVAVTDSGCDDDLCFFQNLNGVRAVTDASDTLPPQVGPIYSTRKVLGYWIQPGATAYDNNASCSGSPTAYHGTHTSGTAVGDNFANPSSPTDPGVDVGDGMAPNAQLLFQDAGNDPTGCLAGLGDFFNTLLQASRGGARVHSNSWGGQTRGTYTADDALVDRFLFDHEEMAVFFSAGNDGTLGGRTIGSPGNSKDAVTVGALGHGASTAIASFSSRGPTADGRTKPDVVAPGTGTVSAAGNGDHADLECATKSLSGTSMSTPTVAGGSALLRQYFADGYYPTGRKSPSDAFDVPGPLVKAVLLNGTLPLGTFGGPDFGWGRIFLDNSLYFAGDARGLRAVALANADGLTTGEARSFEVRVAAGQELRATLAWFDAEGTLGAASSLVNDLDLEVTNGTTTWLGNVLDGFGSSLPGGSPDRLNTVEQVRLAVPAAGTYTVTVRAASVPGNGRSTTARQGFGLAISQAACPSAVSSAPPAPQLASDPSMGVNVTVSPAASSTVTHVYRAEGGCAAPAASFRWVGSTPGSSLLDARAQGGKTYGYRLRGGDACGEGPLSSCSEIVPTGRCDLVPAFAGVATATAGNPSCQVTVTWSPGAAGCPANGGALRYNVYRGTDPDFVANSDSVLTTVEGATSYVDAGPGLPAGHTWFYRVEAEDKTSGGPGRHFGNDTPAGAAVFAGPYGAPGALGTFRDDAADGVATLKAEAPWSIVTGGISGVTSYLSGPGTTTYPPDTCGSITTPPLPVGTGAVLGYWARWNLEFEYDGVRVEISGDGGATWADLPPSAGYPGTLAQTSDDPFNACKLPKTTKVFTGPFDNSGLTPWVHFDSALPSTYEGKTVLIRWRFSSDPGSEYDGFYLDGITVTNVRAPAPCSAVPRGQVPGAGDGQSGAVPKG